MATNPGNTTPDGCRLGGSSWSRRQSGNEQSGNENDGPSLGLGAPSGGAGASGGDYHPPASPSSPPASALQPLDIEHTSSIESSKPSFAIVRELFKKQPSLSAGDSAGGEGTPNPSISQSFSTGRSTYHLAPRPYKGFSTPLCGLFATSGGLPTADHLHPSLHHQDEATHHRREVQYSHLRTDLCSLPCFGVMQSDHTRYLFTHTRPPTFFKRACLHFIFPVTLFLIAGWCSGNIRNNYANSVVCTALIYCIVVWIISGCWRSRRKRVMVREEILWRLNRREEKIKKRMEERRERLTLGGTGTVSAGQMAAESEEYEYYSEDEYEYHKKGYETSLGQSRFEMNCAHRMLGCYPSDIPREGGCSTGAEADDYVLQREIGATDFDGDLCTKLWSCFARPCVPCVPCCNNSYGCHPQVCGLCALAQEAREANLTLPRHLRMVDYITMEPFLLYYPRIVELRRAAVSSFWEHLTALSSLSKLLLLSFKVTLLCLLLISLSSAIAYWKLSDVAVLVATFVQSLAVMYCVHWGWHRFDLSIDAVIKYFACGFCLCTALAFGIELAEYLLFQGVVVGIVYVMQVTEVEDDGYGGGSLHDGWQRARSLGFFGSYGDLSDVGHGRALSAADDIMQGFFDRHPAARILYILISSYIMAGLVEEVVKYFGFVMVDHPDFSSERELQRAKDTMPLQMLREDEAEEEDESVETAERERRAANQKSDTATTMTELASFNPAMQRRSLSSIRAGVTCAMVAVALGFSCCENLFHIFIYNRSSLRSEISTLIVKSLFPVHPIAAAIQSIYVCRRDLEKDPSIGLGRIVLPSLIFHGTYDFVLLTITSSWQRGHKEQYFYQGESVTGVAAVSFGVSLLIVAMGGLFYWLRSRAQYARLQGDSGSNGNNSALSEASFGLLL
ncbi:hypothetical protein ACHAXT_005778 [Thalassiosira profunda]